MSTGLRGAGIIGVGAFAPPKVLTNADLEKIVDTTDEWIVTRSGIQRRHIVDPGTAASDLAVEAATRALESASLTADKLDLIICATISGDTPLPSTACLVQERIGATNAAAFDLQAACSGWVYSLSIASQFVRTGVYDHVLVIGADVLSSVTDWTDRATCVLLGDGAGATVVGPVEEGAGVLSTYLGADGSGASLLKIDAGGSRLPASEATVRNRQHFITMEGREVYKFAVRIMVEASIKALDACGLTPEDIDLFVPHQANLRIIESAVQRLKLPEEKVFVNVQEYGNTSAASIPMALDEAYRSGRIKKGDIVVVVGFGGGLHLGFRRDEVDDAVSRTAFVFPGQGSQCVGMGKDLYDSFPEAREVFDEADDLLGFALSKLCFEGPEDELRLTVNTQPALFTTSIAALRLIERGGISPDVVAGHSSGEYAALVAARALSFRDGLLLVRRRGELMQEASQAHPGTMAAIIGLNADEIRSACLRASGNGIVDVANYNSPVQVVISGEMKAVEAAGACAKEAGARKVMQLNVAGAFHSRLMQPAAERLSKELEQIHFSDAKVPVVANASADYARRSVDIKSALARQIAGSVYWEQSVARMIDDGVDLFVEVGPGKVLSGLIKRISDSVEARTVGDVESLEAFLAAVSGACF